MTKDSPHVEGIDKLAGGECDPYCANNAPDMELIETLEHQGDHDAAAIVRAEVEERRSRCLRVIIVNGMPECGLVHGLTRPLETK